MRRALRNRRLWKIGGIIAGVILIAFGAVSIWMGATGVGTVRDNLAREQIEGSGETSLDGYTVAEGELVNTGTEARAFADLMRTHALEASDGLVYAEMGRYQAAADPGSPASTMNPIPASRSATPTTTPNRATRSPKYAWFSAVANAVWVTQVSRAGFGTGFPSSSSTAASGSLVPAGLPGSAAA